VPNRAPRIAVLAGVNGSGKSSVAGAQIRQNGGNYYNPDEFAKELRKNSSMSETEANSHAWREGKLRLEAAIENRTDFIFETTLGANTIPGLLAEALDEGIDVVMIYVGLDSVDRNIARVRARAQAGGHDIPEEKIRERYTSSMANLVKLAPRLTELRVMDNSIDVADVKTTLTKPLLLLHAKNGKIVGTCNVTAFPEWAKPVLGQLLP
jgi:predicted ABC-type ATPase